MAIKLICRIDFICLVTYLVSILAFGCEKYDSAGTFSYTMQVFNSSLDQDSFQNQGAQSFKIVTAGIGSGVVSGYGYNQGLYVLAYSRIKRDGEDRDLFLSFDIPISADQRLVGPVVIQNLSDLFAELVEERVKDGQEIYRNAYPRDGRFLIDEIYFNNEGIVGVDLQFEINFGDRLIENGSFQTKDSAQSIKSKEEEKNKNKE
jgi:hypothetical protein